MYDFVNGKNILILLESAPGEGLVPSPKERGWGEANKQL
jgi:hypothetical protein